MTTIYKALIEWVWGKASDLILILIEKIKHYFKYREIEEGNADQALLVDKIRLEIIELVKAGKEVPPELKEKLRVETSRLIHGTNGSNGSK